MGLNRAVPISSRFDSRSGKKSASRKDAKMQSQFSETSIERWLQPSSYQASNNGVHLNFREQCGPVKDLDAIVGRIHLLVTHRFPQDQWRLMAWRLHQVQI
jgi:hypothetical protein